MRFDSSTASCSWHAHLKAWFGSWIWLDREESHQKANDLRSQFQSHELCKIHSRCRGFNRGKQYLEDQSILLAKKWSVVLR